MKVNNKKCFQDSRNVNSFWNFHSTFFFFYSSPSKQYFFLTFHFSKFDENSFYFLLSDTFAFFFFFFSPFFSLIFFSSWILSQTTTLKQTDQISSWSTMDKGFKKERLIKRLNGVTSDNVSRKKSKTHI